MITVGMIKKILETIPDDFVIDFDGLNIKNVVLMNKSIEDVTKNILKCSLFDYCGSISSIFYTYKQNHEKLNLSTFIYKFKNDELNLRFSNIDEGIKKLVICKLYDNYKYLNQKIKEFNEDENDDELNSLRNLTTAFKKVLL